MSKALFPEDITNGPVCQILRIVLGDPPRMSFIEVEKLLGIVSIKEVVDGRDLTLNTLALIILDVINQVPYVRIRLFIRRYNKRELLLGPRYCDSAGGGHP